MPRRYPPEMRRQVIELSRHAAHVKQLVATFAVSQATVSNWIRQDVSQAGSRLTRTAAPLIGTTQTPSTTLVVDQHREGAG